MPEGPEVRRMAEGLAKRIVGKELREAEILGGKWLKKEPTGIDVIRESLANKSLSVDWVKVKGKFIYAKIGDLYMWNTLGMSGGWRDLRGKHSHFVLRFSDSSEVFFEDVRRFGNISFYSDFDDVQKKLNGAGPDMLNSKVTFTEFYGRLAKSPNKNICKAIMDQKVISGVGNYIKSEALYRAGISPHLKISDIPMNKMESLCEWITTIIKTSYEQGGATLATYTDMDNNHGDFVFSFNVYRKNIDPLGNSVVHEITDDGRMTHWVPEIQS
jgi:DNA-formamidopyrimidine glycosylase